MADYFALLSHPDHLESLELEILKRRDAFSLPSKAICDALFDIFFKWIAPVLPVVNRNDFIRKYHHPEDHPPILLVQAVFVVASRFYRNEQGHKDPAISPRVFYKKAKALYDAGYEQNRTTILQAVALLGIYWDGPDDLTESGIFYWSHLGIALAQELGLHESEKYEPLSASDKGIWKRIWWTLYTRDRAVAAAFGRPLHINSEDCTVEPLTESDFIEYDEQFRFEYPVLDEIRVQFFIQYVKLCQLMDLGLCLKLSSRSTQDSRSRGVAQCELGLNDWLVSCPPELQWRQSRHNFWSAMLYSNFYTIVCQLNLLQTPYSSKESQNSAFHAASTIVSILETLYSQRELQYTPSFIICHTLVSFVTLKCQMDASVSSPSLLHAIRLKVEANMEMLEEVSQTWPVGTMFLELLRIIFGPEHFNRLLAIAVEDCRKRVCGDEDSSSPQSRPTAPYKRPKLQQVVLPQTRIVLQILRRDTRRQPTPPIKYQDATRIHQEDEVMPFGFVPGNTNYPASGDVELPPEDCDPSLILQSLRDIIEVGRRSSQISNNAS